MIEPRALNELIPDWKDKGVRLPSCVGLVCVVCAVTLNFPLLWPIRPCVLQAPIYTEATEDHFVFLGEGFHVRLPTPPQMHNKVTIKNYYYYYYK